MYYTYLNNQENIFKFNGTESKSIQLFIISEQTAMRKATGILRK